MLNARLRQLMSVIGVLLILTTIGKSDEEVESDMPRKSSHFSLQDFQWLAGHWVGDGFGGTCEETWTPPSGGSMSGTFKLSVDGRVQFYELFTLTIDTAGLPVLELKHFNADLSGWEERDDKVVFPYEASGTNEITLGAVTYRKISADSLQVDVSVKDKSGQVSVETLKLGRVKL